jgi:hypothetical protein
MTSTSTLLGPLFRYYPSCDGDDGDGSEAPPSILAFVQHHPPTDPTYEVSIKFAIPPSHHPIIPSSIIPSSRHPHQVQTPRPRHTGLSRDAVLFRPHRSCLVCELSDGVFHHPPTENVSFISYYYIPAAYSSPNTT